jgi:hypothetical protein
MKDFIYVTWYANLINKHKLYLKYTDVYEEVNERSP